jgi:hypothetical protein
VPAAPFSVAVTPICTPMTWSSSLQEFVKQNSLFQKQESNGGLSILFSESAGFLPPNFFWFDLSFRFEIKSLSFTYQYLVELHHGYFAHHSLSKGFRPSKTDSLYVAENSFETRQNRTLTLLMQFATSIPPFKNKMLQIESTKLTLNSPSQKTQEEPSL